jgi:hypothetical protein
MKTYTFSMSNCMQVVTSQRYEWLDLRFYRFAPALLGVQEPRRETYGEVKL